MAATSRPPVESEPPPLTRLGYLLKHAQARMAELNREALSPYGIDGRDLVVLQVIADQESASQQDAARRLGVDRTTMVALVDALEAKGLVARQPHAEDRRKKVVTLTTKGRGTLRRASRAGDEAEQRLLAALSTTDAARLRKLLATIVHHGTDPVGGPQQHP